MAQRAGKQSTITKGTEPHACIENETHMQLFLVVNMAKQHGSQTCAPNDNDNIAQCGSHTPAYTKSCSLGLQYISLILDIHVMVN